MCFAICLKMDKSPGTQTYKIVCTSYPEIFDEDKSVCKTYFRQFGKVLRLIYKPKQRCIVVEYTNQNDYLNALAGPYECEGQSFKLQPYEPPSVVKEEKPKKKIVSRHKLSYNTDLVKKPQTWYIDTEEINDELAAMGSYGMKGTIETSVLKRLPKLNRVWTKPEPQLKKQLGHAIIKKKVTQQKMLSTEQLDLLKLIKSQAITIDDKYKVLDARDKLLRSNLKKALKTGPTLGTCPDMCPEKERLLRQIQHQVSIYEQTGRIMDHNKAVKQYSRSSADQESPLPHELRPVDTLKLTMSYLTHNIMNLLDEESDVNVGEWFHFLWDRTRGIRKDITQQALCCQDSVDLVEQCARFHIHCSARLMGEDPSVFDQKINTENLTKCLQTLKYMYQDLSLKGLSCPNEAEFRAYIILLNLNDGNFMWEVQQLQRHIQKSSEVKFALQVYSCFDKRNFVTFFKLIEGTTYLNACILMRYFVQIRVQALEIMTRCFVARKNITYYTVQELVRMLYFDDEDCAEQFITSYGIEIESGYVLIQKSSFYLPELPYLLSRSNRVELKRVNSTGVIIQGKEMDAELYMQVQTHQVYNSFNEQNYLIKDDIFNDIETSIEERLLDDNDSREDVIDNKSQSPVNIFATKDDPDKANIFASVSKPNRASKGGFSFILSRPSTEVPNIFAIKPSEHKDLELEALENERDRLEEELRIDEEEEELRREEEQEELRREKEQEERRREEEQEELRREEEQDEKRRKIEEAAEQRRIVMERLKREEEEERIEEERRRELERRLQEEERLQEELLRQQLLRDQEMRRKLQQREIKAAVTEVINHLVTTVDQKVRQQTLLNIRLKMQRRLLIKLATKWRNIASKRTKKRKALDCNPIFVHTMSLSQCAQGLHSNSQDLALRNMKRYKYGRPLEVSIVEQEPITRLSLFNLTYSSLRRRLCELKERWYQRIFWKVVVSIPDIDEMDLGLHKVENTLQLYTNWQRDKYGNTVYMEYRKTITYCVEKQQGFEVKTYDSNAFVFIAKSFNEKMQRRIFENLKDFGVCVRVPVALILEDTANSEQYLCNLRETGIVSEYCIYSCNLTSHVLPSIIDNALIFLAKRVENYPPLELDTLSNVLYNTSIWKKTASYAKWNHDYNLCMRDPNVVISLHNEALDRLSTLVFDKKNKEYAVFPPVFKPYLTPGYIPCDYRYFPEFWTDDCYHTALKHVIDMLKLPRFTDKWPPNNETDLIVSLSKYCEQIFADNFKESLVQLLDIFSIDKVLWTDAVNFIGQVKLREINLKLPPQFTNSNFHTFIVVYDIDAYNNLCCSDWFYRNNPVVESYKKLVYDQINIPVRAKKRPLENYNSNQQEISEILTRASKLLKSPFNQCLEMKPQIEELHKSIHDLEDSIRVVKKLDKALLDKFNK